MVFRAGLRDPCSRDVARLSESVGKCSLSCSAKRMVIFFARYTSIQLHAKFTNFARLYFLHFTTIAKCWKYKKNFVISLIDHKRLFLVDYVIVLEYLSPLELSIKLWYKLKRQKKLESQIIALSCCVNILKTDAVIQKGCW